MCLMPCRICGGKRFHQEARQPCHTMWGHGLYGTTATIIEQIETVSIRTLRQVAWLLKIPKGQCLRGNCNDTQH